jgi:hypothetical protein
MTDLSFPFPASGTIARRLRRTAIAAELAVICCVGVVILLVLGDMAVSAVFPIEDPVGIHDAAIGPMPNKVIYADGETVVLLHQG